VDQMGTAGPASLLYCSPHDVHRQNTYLLMRSSYLLTLHEYCTLKTHRLLICRCSDRCQANNEVLPSLQKIYCRPTI
jgi:hypothetical protein